MEGNKYTFSNSYVGNTIQITNSPYYGEIHYKHNPYFDLNEEIVAEQVSNVAMSLSEDVCDENKTEFLTFASTLGSLDGGDFTLEQINSRLEDKDHVSKKEIFFIILKSIFPGKGEEFYSDVLAQVESIYDGKDYPSEEARVVDIAFDLKLIANYMNTTNKWDDAQATKFVFDEIANLKVKAKKNGGYELSPKIKKTIKVIKQYRLKSYVAPDYNDLFEIVDRYKNKEITRDEFINELFYYRNKKKTKGMK